MRKIKFRAWNVDDEIMLYSDFNAMGFYSLENDQEIAENTETVFMYHAHTGDKDFVLLQYTGLKDKNGVEIYEGDILEYPDLDKGVYLFKEQPKRRSVMKWHEQDAAFKIPGTGFRINTERVEVVGNIHENPDLLETK